MRKYFIVLFICLSFNFYAQEADSFFSKADEFFKINVNDGKVAYVKIHSDRTLLDEIMNLAENYEISKDDANIYQAFWINAYNLSVIKGIVDNYPIKSPMDKSGFFDGIKYKLGGKKITLNDIEHKLLRKEFNDTRIHFVLVCGAKGCPPLISNVYSPESLDEQMTKQTKNAMNGNYFIKVDSKKKRVYGSEILKWYKDDFTKNGSEIDFINEYRDNAIPDNFKLSYYSYNWELNSQ